MRNSRNWTINLPTGLGPFDPFANLRCGDLDGAKDNLRILPGSVYGRDVAVSGRRYEMARVTDESQAGTLNLSCTEEAASGLDLMRVIGCPFPIQRRDCSPDTPTYYEHYAAVNLGERTLEMPTATGIDKTDDTPMVSFPGIFSRRFPLTDKMPDDFDFGDDIPMGIVYCYNPLCGDCGRPCDRLYALLRTQLDENTTEMELHRSDDGGQTWQVVPNIPQMREPSAFIFCYQGSRLFVGEEDGPVYYSDNPEGEEWYESVQLNDLIGSNWVTKMASDGYTIFAIVGDANQTGVVRSSDAGLTWEFVMAVDSLTTGQIRDIAVAGNAVATYGETGAGVGQVLYSYQFGDWQTWANYSHASLPINGAIGVANPNPFDLDRAWFYIMGDDSGFVAIWKASDPQDWTRIYRANGGHWVFCQIFLDGDGYIGWFHACDEDGTSVTLRTSTGGKSFVDVSLPDTSSDSDVGRAVLAVCPHDPDEGFVGWHSETPETGEE